MESDSVESIRSAYRRMRTANEHRGLLAVTACFLLARCGNDEADALGQGKGAVAVEYTCAGTGGVQGNRILISGI